MSTFGVASGTARYSDVGKHRIFALESGGRDAALMELQRRWPWLDEHASPATLDWITAPTSAAPGALSVWPRCKGLRRKSRQEVTLLPRANVRPTQR